MKVVQINATCGVGSTGKICVDISRNLTENDIENYILYSNKTNGYELGITCANRGYTKLQALKSHVLGNYGFNSRFETKQMIKHLNKIEPDIVHLHNIHGHDCNLELLFRYLKDCRTKIVWTFHDCWAFTGYCTHFVGVSCDKWKNKCESCIQYKEFSFFADRSKELFQRKKELFTEIDMTIVVPSVWLENIVKESFLGIHNVKVINNGIDLNMFRVCESDFRKRYQIPETKKILLGVAFDWGIRKGLDVFVDLAKQIDKQKYQIVLVGTNEEVEKMLPSNIIAVRRTQSQIELAEIYSVADVFVNLTREDTFPTVNIEALACGTPILTLNTGGSPEIVDEKTGIVLSSKEISSIIEVVEKLCNSDVYRQENCVIRAKQYDKKFKYQEYLELYKAILLGNCSE